MIREAKSSLPSNSRKLCKLRRQRVDSRHARREA
jgi:hypothetical protein